MHALQVEDGGGGEGDGEEEAEEGDGEEEAEEGDGEQQEPRVDGASNEHSQLLESLASDLVAEGDDGEEGEGEEGEGNEVADGGFMDEDGADGGGASAGDDGLYRMQDMSMAEESQSNRRSRMLRALRDEAVALLREAATARTDGLLTAAMRRRALGMRRRAAAFAHRSLG
eukprot:5629282-Prymnesium_polylepis.1